MVGSGNLPHRHQTRPHHRIVNMAKSLSGSSKTTLE
jgi:hypothetical protein